MMSDVGKYLGNLCEVRRMDGILYEMFGEAC